MGLVLLSSCESLGAAPYDCETAASAVELAICGDETLIAADKEMTFLYERVRLVDPELEAQQAAWVTGVRDACGDMRCLAKVYLERIDELEGQTGALDISRSESVPTEKTQDRDSYTLATRSFSPSFDCLQARTLVEALICGDETLSAADQEMARLFTQLAQDQPEVRIEQARWLAAVRNACEDKRCLSASYLQRISDLERQIEDWRARSEPITSVADEPLSTEPSIPSPSAEGSQGDAGRAFKSEVAEQAPMALLLICLAFVYFLPSIVAFNRGHEHRWAILLANVFLAPTVAGWFIVLAFATGLIGGGAAVSLAYLTRQHGARRT